MLKPCIRGGYSCLAILRAYSRGEDVDVLFYYLFRVSSSLEKGDAEMIIGGFVVNGGAAPFVREDTEHDGGFPASSVGRGFQKNAAFLWGLF